MDLDVRNLIMEYTSGAYVVRALDRVSFFAPSGELVLLLGPSGSGKTTLLSCLAAILKPTSGEILFGDTTVTGMSGKALTEYRRNTVGIVFQSFNLVPSLTAAENVDSPLRSGGMKAKIARARALELLELVGLSDRANHRPGDLSGGQQQRVAIARALGFDPPLLLADEPTAHLDYTQVEVVLRVLRSLASPGRVVVVSTHDERIVPLADRVIELTPELAHDKATKRKELRAGEVLFEERSRGALIYIVDDGEIEILRSRAEGGGDEVVATYGRDEYFGELGPLLGFPRAGTARARVESVVTGYTVPEFREMVGADKISSLLGTEGTKRRSSNRKPAKRKAAKRQPAKRKPARSRKSR
jgi:putative ABC transport system ATP-binding protein